MLTVLEWAATLVSFTGTGLVATHHAQGWWLCMIADVGFVIFALNKKLFGFLALCAGYAVLNLIGALNS